MPEEVSKESTLSPISKETAPETTTPEPLVVDVFPTKDVVIYSVDVSKGVSIEEVKKAIEDGLKSGTVVVPVGVTVNTVNKEATHVVQDVAKIYKFRERPV